MKLLQLLLLVRVRGEETANLFHYLWGLNSKCGSSRHSAAILEALVLAFGVANILSVTLLSRCGRPMAMMTQLRRRYGSSGEENENEPVPLMSPWILSLESTTS